MSVFRVQLVRRDPSSTLPLPWSFIRPPNSRGMAQKSVADFLAGIRAKNLATWFCTIPRPYGTCFCPVTNSPGPMCTYRHIPIPHPCPRVRCPGIFSPFLPRGGGAPRLRIPWGYTGSPFSCGRTHSSPPLPQWKTPPPALDVDVGVGVDGVDIERGWN